MLFRVEMAAAHKPALVLFWAFLISVFLDKAVGALMKLFTIVLYVRETVTGNLELVHAFWK